MRYSPHASMEDISVTGENPAENGIRSAVESAKGAKFGRYSRVCRRTFGTRNVLNKVPEDEVLDFRRIPKWPKIEQIPTLHGRTAPPGKKPKPQLAPETPKEENIQRRAGFWKVFKMRGSETKRKTRDHHMDATSLLSFV